MEKKARLLFDECIPKPVLQSLIGAQTSTGELIEFGFALDDEFGGGLDDVWIPKVVGQGWIVITADRGKRWSRGKAKLPILCRQHRITHVAFSASIHQLNKFAKREIVAAHLEELVALRDVPPGRRYHLQLNDDGTESKLVFRQEALPPLDDP